MATAENFAIKTEVFEGPLDLLLTLIEKRKLFINDIALAKVARDYMEYVKELEHLPVGQTANFILIASTLLLIKSKSLLPTLSLSQEEEGSIDDLETRLKLYKFYKELALNIKASFGKNILFSKSPSKDIPVVFSPENTLTISAAEEAIRNLIQSFPKQEKLSKATVDKVVSLEEMIENLTERIKSNLKLSFTEFAKNHSSSSKGSLHKTDREGRLNIIIGFLAMLELVKQGIISASQEAINSDIELETKDLGIPSYN